MLDQEAINQQLSILAAHRRTLAHLLEQAAAYGGVVLAPPQTDNGIAEARQQIRRIKAVLRKNGVQVEDDPNVKAPRRRKPTQSQKAGDVVSGDKVAGDKVGGDKVMGGKRTVDTGSGDYAEGNIDKRQGNFISGGTVQGPVITDNQGTVNVNYNYQRHPDAVLHQLRAPVGDFVGRTAEIDKLVSALSIANSGASAISGVRGMGGIGKTELAYKVAQRLAEQFPDAQLLIELRGASDNPLTPAQALQSVIRAFKREAKLPDDAGELRNIYCSVLAGKKALIFADDARDAAQVRPLLPPHGCALLVTSRHRFSLPGLVALDLGTLPPEEASKLLLEICPHIGEHAPKLAQLCGYLPLALRVSASLLKENDSRDVVRYLEQLRAERLKHLSDPDNPDDPQASVEASLTLSLEALDPVARRSFCLLSIFLDVFGESEALYLIAEKPEAVIGEPEEVPTIKQSGSVSVTTIRRVTFRAKEASILELLRRRSLLEWVVGLYRFHDIVQEFAQERLKAIANDPWFKECDRLEHAMEFLNLLQFNEDDIPDSRWGQRLSQLKRLRQRLAASQNQSPADTPDEG